MTESDKLIRNETEAIECLKSNKPTSGYVMLQESIDMAIKALEKQIPKKPILKNGESGSFVDYEDGHGEYKVTKWQDWVCPICGWFVGQRYNRSQNHSHDQRKCNYCNECGQKIDWSDEE